MRKLINRNTIFFHMTREINFSPLDFSFQMNNFKSRMKNLGRNIKESVENVYDDARTQFDIKDTIFEHKKTFNIDLESIARLSVDDPQLNHLNGSFIQRLATQYGMKVKRDMITDKNQNVVQVGFQFSKSVDWKAPLWKMEESHPQKSVVEKAKEKKSVVEKAKERETIEEKYATKSPYEKAKERKSLVEEYKERKSLEEQYPERKNIFERRKEKKEREREAEKHRAISKPPQERRKGQYCPRCGAKLTAEEQDEEYCRYCGGVLDIVLFLNFSGGYYGIQKIQVFGNILFRINYGQNNIQLSLEMDCVKPELKQDLEPLEDSLIKISRNYVSQLKTIIKEIG